MVIGLDPALIEIVGRSLYVSLVAVGIASLIGLPLGAAVAIFSFPGRRVIAVTLNALMGLPPVVVGLLVYLLLSRAGAFGTLGLLFTPGAMIIAQTLLILPIVASLSRHSTRSGVMFQPDAARSAICCMASSAAMSTAWPVTFTVRLPPETKL